MARGRLCSAGSELTQGEGPRWMGLAGSWALAAREQQGGVGGRAIPPEGPAVTAT